MRFSILFLLLGNLEVLAQTPGTGQPEPNVPHETLVRQMVYAHKLPGLLLWFSEETPTPAETRVLASALKEARAGDAEHGTDAVEDFIERFPDSGYVPAGEVSIRFGRL